MEHTIPRKNITSGYPRELNAPALGDAGTATISPRQALFVLEGQTYTFARDSRFDQQDYTAYSNTNADNQQVVLWPTNNVGQFWLANNGGEYSANAYEIARKHVVERQRDEGARYELRNRQTGDAGTATISPRQALFVLEGQTYTFARDSQFDRRGYKAFSNTDANNQQIVLWPVDNVGQFWLANNGGEYSANGYEIARKHVVERQRIDTGNIGAQVADVQGERVHVTVELLDVKCNGTEDVTGADHFFIAGNIFEISDTGQTLTKTPVLTDIVKINDRQTFPLLNRQWTPQSGKVFDAAVHPNSRIVFRLAAFDSDAASDWNGSDYQRMCEALGDLAAKGGRVGGPKAAAVGEAIQAGLKVVNIGVSLDKDDLLGDNVDETYVSEITDPPTIDSWRMVDTGIGASTWDYTVRYRVRIGAIPQVKLKLVSVKCRRQEDSFGKDDPYIKLSGIPDAVWRARMSNGSLARPNTTIKRSFAGQVVMQLWEDDNDRDDFLGAHWIDSPQLQMGRSYTAAFTRNGAHYDVTYQVLPLPGNRR